MRVLVFALLFSLFILADAYGVSMRVILANGKSYIPHAEVGGSCTQTCYYRSDAKSIHAKYVNYESEYCSYKADIEIEGWAKQISTGSGVEWFASRSILFRD